MLTKWMSAGLAATCAAASAYHYETTVYPGHGPGSAWFIAGLAALVGLIWALWVFPRMGRGLVRDLIWIVAAFPCVGAATGLLAGFGSPVGLYVGAYVAVALPFMSPVEILPVYFCGAVAAFLWPRVRFSAP